MSDKSILKEVVSYVMRLHVHVFTVKKNISFVKVAIVKQINSEIYKTDLFRFTKQFNFGPSSFRGNMRNPAVM